MKKFATLVFIILIFLPMLIYMNPFIWGMRMQPRYKPSWKTTLLISNLNEKYNLNIGVGNVIDTLWYFRDLKHKRSSKLENFQLDLIKEDSITIDVSTVKEYINDFNKNFEHRDYFDSIFVIMNYDTVIYNGKIR